MYGFEDQDIIGTAGDLELAYTLSRRLGSCYGKLPQVGIEVIDVLSIVT